MEDCDTTAAIRLICSEEKPVYESEEVHVKLTERNPAPNKDRQQFNDANLTAAIQLSEKEILTAICSFPAGSSGGPNGVQPKHILDLVSCKKAGHKLLTAITGFVNMLLDGVCHSDVISVLFGGNLTALMKRSSGIRPIVVGYMWHRIAAKCVNAFAISSLGDYFAPTQLGVGISGGCEAAVLAVRRFMENIPSDYVVAKWDFSNAFNNLHRDVMLQSVFNTLSDICKFCYLCYGQPTFLRY